jgi:hypothetical protein
VGASEAAVGSHTEMDPRTKIRLEAVEALKRHLEALPPHREDAVTKLQAVRMLVPDIQAMQSKGYSLGAIAECLTERGLPISAVALKSYLSHVKGGFVDKKRRRRLRRSGETVASEKASAVAVRGAGGEGVAFEEPEAPPRPEERRSAERTKGLPKASASAAAVAVADRKSMFVPQPDSDDI